MHVLSFENLRGGGGMLNPDKFCPKQNVGTSFGKLNMLFFYIPDWIRESFFLFIFVEIKVKAAQGSLCI